MIIVRIVVFMALVFSSLTRMALSAQSLKERRVYYLDCSYSMKTSGLWDPVRNNLKSAIDSVTDETTELIVIPFAFDNRHHSLLEACSEKATENGKRVLKKKIDAVSLTKNTKTYLSDPLNDFYSSRVDDSRVTYMYLMTDGQNEETPDLFKPLLRKWSERCGNRNAYGFYVMLHHKAEDPAIEEIIDSQKHLWKVQTADVNINLVRLQSAVAFNAREEKYFDVPVVYGKLGGIDLKAGFSGTSAYKVARTELLRGGEKKTA